MQREAALYLAINAGLPLTYQFLVPLPHTSMDFAWLAYVTATTILALNLWRASLGRWFRMVYGVTVLVNICCLILFGMLTYLSLLILLLRLGFQGL